MTDAAPAPVAETPTAPITPESTIPTTPVNPWIPREYELDIKGQKQKVRFETEDQLRAVLQKATYADQVIKESSQKIKGSEALMRKLSTPEGLREVLADPAINMDVKKFAIEIVKEMMEDEKLTPEQRESREDKAALA